MQVIFPCHFKAKSLHCLKPSVKLASMQSYWMNIFGRKSQKDTHPRSWPTVGGKRRAVGGDTQRKRQPVMPSESAETCLRFCLNLGLPTEFRMGALSQFYFMSQMTQRPQATSGLQWSLQWSAAIGIRAQNTWESQHMDSGS